MRRPRWIRQLSPALEADARHALRLVSLGFEREAAGILAAHEGPQANSVRSALAGMTPGEAALEVMPWHARPPAADHPLFLRSQS